MTTLPLASGIYAPSAERRLELDARWDGKGVSYSDLAEAYGPAPYNGVLQMGISIELLSGSQTKRDGLDPWGILLLVCGVVTLTPIS